MVTCDAGAYGAETSKGEPVVKPRRWITNSDFLADNLSRRMTAEQKQYCVTIEGNETERSGAYCDGLVDAILNGVYQARFTKKAYEVMFARPVPDAEAWRSLLDEVESRFTNSNKKPFTLPDNDPMLKAIKELVPWEITRAQAAWLPLARRLPQEFPYTHHGAALRLTSGDFQLEAEDLSSIKCELPEQDPGVQEQPPPLPGDQAEAAPSQRQLRLAGYDAEIWFEDPPREVDRKLQYSLGRLHVNMGHAPKAELVRMLAAAGNLSKKVLTGLDCLRCGSCLRTRQPRPPPTSSTLSNYSGYFGEVLQSDVVYLRMINGENVPVLGVTCEATSYHAAKVLESRQPAHALATLLEIWYRPLGLPLRFKTDPGGEFGGEVTTFHMRHGILRETVPAEAHFRIGKIEREELDQCLIAVLRTINSCTFSHGRSPAQAVFGRVARPLGDLVSDPFSLVTSPDPGLMRPEILRAEAMKALAEHTASSATRRAVLRKTHHQQNLRDLQPGQAVAFWRWSGRSRQHKRGAWALPRFVSHDPDNKSVWLQVNTATVKVANNQVRVACGWEEWTPSPEDIAILKDAERNLRYNLWEDQREEPPTALEDATAELAGQLPARPAPLPVRDQDYWRYVDNRFIRVHVVPRYELYIPVPGDCDFNVDDLADARQTHIHEHEEQPEEDQWRDPRPGPVPQPSFGNNILQNNLALFECLRRPLCNNLNDYLLNGKFTHEELEAQQQTTVQQQQTAVQQQSNVQNYYDNRQTKITYTVTEDKSVPETPPFSAPAPGTPEYQFEARAQPDVPPLSATGLDDGLSVEHTSCPPAATTCPVPVTSTQPASEGAARASTDAPPPQQEQQLPQLPQKRAADVLLSGIFELCVDDFGEAVLQRADETVDMPIPFHNETYYKAYLASKQRVNDLKKDGVNEDPTREDASSSEDEGKTVCSSNWTESCPGKSSLRNHVPSTRSTSSLSVQRRTTNWMRWGGIKPLSHKEADKILSDPKLSKRVLKSRAAYRDKNKGLGEVKAKCRVVLIGCNDPDIFK
ncbi:CML10, partial [Symbiodinium pilosum]